VGAAAAVGDLGHMGPTLAFASPPSPQPGLRPPAATLQGKYASLGLCHTVRDWVIAAVLLGAAAVVLGGNSAYKSVSAARTSIQRKKALAELEKDA
jgi:hypothetical protein